MVSYESLDEEGFKGEGGHLRQTEGGPLANCAIDSKYSVLLKAGANEILRGCRTNTFF